MESAVQHQLTQAGIDGLNDTDAAMPNWYFRNQFRYFYAPKSQYLYLPPAIRYHPKTITKPHKKQLLYASASSTTMPVSDVARQLSSGYTEREMKSPIQREHDHLKHFSKDDAKTRLAALALLRAPAILAAIASVISAAALSLLTFVRFFSL